MGVVESVRCAATRLLCALLAACVALAGLVVPARAADGVAAADAADGGVLVHYYNTDGWADPHMYAYGGGVSESWPGRAMSYDGGGWWSASVASASGVRVLFSDNGDTATQRPARGEPGFDLSSGAWFVGSDQYPAEPEGLRVHYFDYGGWGSARLYWYGDGASGPAWPGVPMHSEGDGWWGATVFGVDHARVIFSDGAGRQVPAAGEEGFDVDGESWYRNGVWTEERPSDIVVLLRKPDSWGEPNVYYYASDSDTGPAWPGVRMTHVHGPWYGYSISRYSRARVLFNDGVSQMPAAGAPGFEAEGLCAWENGAWSCTAGEEATSADGDGDGVPDVLSAVFGDGDTDGDGLPDDYEAACAATDFRVADTDGDGLPDGGEDPDGDGLDNAEERSAGTDPMASDTDGDSLTDSRELGETGTSPLLADTDGDGVDDAREILWGTDPLAVQRDFAVTALSVDTEGNPDGAVSVTVGLPASQAASLSVKEATASPLLPSDIPGLVVAPHEFSVDGELGSASIHFSFDPKLAGDPTFDPAIYWLDEADRRLVGMPTTVEGNVATTEVTHFSTYLLLNRTVFEESFSWEDEWADTTYSSSQVVFVIDDSGSMTSNDPSGKRLSVARDLVDGLPAGSRVGVVRFASDTVVLTDGLVGADEAEAALSDGNFSSSGGTRMYGGVQEALSLFDDDAEDTLRTIVVLSDGETQDTGLHDETVLLANGKKVKINTVGLGGGGPGSYYEEWMEPLASQTGGEYYLAEDAEGLASVFDDIGRGIDIETDSDGDGISDWYEGHLILFNGMRVTLDKDDPDTDEDGIGDLDEIGGLDYEWNADRSRVRVTGRLVSDPTREDSDSDGIADGEEAAYSTDPLKADSDGDGLTDGLEAGLNYDPAGANDDGDTYGDHDEYVGGRDPFSYDRTRKEAFASFVLGALAGDFIADDDSAEYCLGQVVGGLFGVSDVRDAVADASHLDWGGVGLSLAGVVPIGGDAAKGAKIVSRFLKKHLDDWPMLMRVINALEPVCPGLVKELGKNGDFINAVKKYGRSPTDRATREQKRLIVQTIDDAGLGSSLIKTHDVFPNAERVDVDGDLWSRKPFDRGDDFDEVINVQTKAGQTVTANGRTFTPLGKTFPVADRLEGTTLVSTKTLDLDSKAYESPSAVKHILDKNLEALDGMESKLIDEDADGIHYLDWPPNSKKKVRLKQSAYDSKVLEVVVHDTAMPPGVRDMLRQYEGVHEMNGLKGPMPITVRFLIG